MFLTLIFSKLSTISISSCRTRNTATMPSASIPGTSQPAKRSRPPIVPDPTREDRRKRQKSTAVKSSQREPIRSSLPVTRTYNKPPQPKSLELIPKSSKTDSSKSAATSALLPIRSDLLQSSLRRRGKYVPLLDLTGDVSDEPTEPHSPRYNDSGLQKKLSELTSERNDYRESLHDANAKIQKYKEADLLRKARAEVESDEREAEAAAKAAAASRELWDMKDKNNQLSQWNKDLDEQLKTKDADTARLQQLIDKQLAELKEHKDNIQSLQQTLDKKIGQHESDVHRLQPFEQKWKDCKSNNSRLQEALNTQVKEHQSDVHRLGAVEKQLQEHESDITRLQAEVAKAKDEVDEHKWAADWFRGKFLKFKALFSEQKKECKEKDAAIQQILVGTKMAACLFDFSAPVEELDLAVEKLRAQACKTDVAEDAPVMDAPLVYGPAIVSEG